MNFKEYQELMKLMNDVTSKTAYLSKLFGQPPATPRIELQLAQKKALRDIDSAWDTFKQKAKDLNSWTEETKQNPLI
jgi:hypothetical protein